MNQLTEFTKNAQGLTKNPLGIIALFISLIYGIAALVLSTSSGRLSLLQNWAIVLFIIEFPILILVAFVYLVVKHHQKLYSPSDYRDESNFFRQMNTLERSEKYQEEVQNLLQNETTESIADTEKVQERNNTYGIYNLFTSGENNTKFTELAKAAARLTSELSDINFLVEEFVLRVLESELKIHIKRQMALDSKDGVAKFDGIAFKQNEVIAIEVKFNNNGNISKNTIQSLRKLVETTLKIYKDDKKIRFIFVFVSEIPFVNRNKALHEISEGLKDYTDIDIRFYELDELKKLYS